MTDEKSKAATQDLSRFGLREEIEVGDKVEIDAGQDAEIVGLPNGSIVVVTEIKNDGVMFRVEPDVKEPARDYLVWAKQIA